MGQRGDPALSIVLDRTKVNTHGRPCSGSQSRALGGGSSMWITKGKALLAAYSVRPWPRGDRLGASKVDGAKSRVRHRQVHHASARGCRGRSVEVGLGSGPRPACLSRPPAAPVEASEQLNARRASRQVVTDRTRLDGAYLRSVGSFVLRRLLLKRCGGCQK
jgi:hypothetical protein